MGELRTALLACLDHVERFGTDPDIPNAPINYLRSLSNLCSLSNLIVRDMAQTKERMRVWLAANDYPQDTVDAVEYRSTKAALGWYNTLNEKVQAIINEPAVPDDDPTDPFGLDQ